MESVPRNIYESGVPLGQEAERLESFRIPSKLSLELIGQLHPGSKVLDVGSGTNLDLNQYVQQQRGEYVALDKNPDFLKRHESAGVRTVLADVNNLPFDTGSFDVVHARFVFAHLGGDKASGINEVFRVVKPRGRAVFIDYDWSVAEGTDAFNQLRDLFIKEMLFDAAFGSKLEDVVRETINSQAATITGKRFPILKMDDYEQVLKLREAANKDLDVQDKDIKILQTCDAIFDQLEVESTSATAPGFRFPDLVAVVVVKN